MIVERTDTIEGIMYIMTETHRFHDILSELKALEPRTIPIKHVGTGKSEYIATGYKIPSDTPSLEKILHTLRQKEV